MTQATQSSPLTQAPPTMPAGAPPADAVMMQMLMAPLMQQCIYVATELNIPDLVAAQPQTAAELAARTNTHEPSLYRMLRALAGAGIFAENQDRQFELTPLASLLCREAPNSLRDWALVLGQEWHWRISGELMHSVKTGNTAQKKVYGLDSWDFMAQNPEIGATFNRAMTNLSQLVIPTIVASYDFSGVQTLVDVAGGYGSLLAGVLQANPRVQGVLFDQPPIIAGAGELIAQAGLSDRVHLAAGDFFESVPAGADTYMMKHILHDWDDARSIAILQNIRAAMAPDGKLLIMEMVVPPGNQPSAAKIADVQMLIGPGGQERTAAEYRSLLASAGFQLTNIYPTRSPVSVLEAKKV